MKRLSNFIGVGLLITTLLLLGVPAAFAQEPEYVFRAAASGTPGIEYGDVFFFGFKEKVEEYSEGRIRVDLYLGNALGGERETIEMLMQGLIEISMVSDSVYSIFEPKWAIMDLPYFVSTREQAWAFLDGEGGDRLAELMLAKGVRILAYGENNVRQISNSKREIRSPRDLRGLKIRVPENPAQVDWLRSVGAIPTVLPFPELFPALQQGVVDGQENGMLYGFYANFHEVQSFWTDTNHDYSGTPIAINEALWQSLPPELQDALQRAADEVVELNRQAILKAESEVISNLQKLGVKVTLLTPEERLAFEATAKPIWQKYAPRLGNDFMDWAFALVGKKWR